jgi:hypothetical protein
VDIVWEHLKPGRRRWLDIAATTLTLAFLAPLAWMVWIKVAGTGTQGTSDLRLPLVWFYAVAAVRAAWPPCWRGALVLLWQGGRCRSRQRRTPMDRDLVALLGFVLHVRAAWRCACPSALPWALRAWAALRCCRVFAGAEPAGQRAAVGGDGLQPQRHPDVHPDGRVRSVPSA